MTTSPDAVAENSINIGRVLNKVSDGYAYNYVYVITGVYIQRMGAATLMVFRK